MIRLSQADLRRAGYTFLGRDQCFGNFVRLRGHAFVTPSAPYKRKGDRMVTWKTFAHAAPEIAGAGRAQFFQFGGVGLAFLATVRKDGAPRVHPVCPLISDDRLFVLITSASPKQHDLLRDGRYALQAFPQPKAGSDEFYLAGKAMLVDDAATRAAILRDAKHMAAPSEITFELLIDRAMLTRWENVLTPEMRSVHEKWHAP